MTDPRQLSGRELDRRVAGIKARERSGDERVRIGRASLHWSSDDALSADLRREFPRYHLTRGRTDLDIYECWVLYTDDQGRTSTTPKARGDSEAEATARAYIFFKERR